MAIIWLVLALPVGILFLVHLYSDLKLKISGIETVWVVTNVKTEYRTNDVEHYSISLKYDCWSKEWIEKDGIGTSNTYYRVDEKIPLYCDEYEPWKFIMKEEVTFRNILSDLLFLLMFFLPWFIIFLIWIKRAKGQKKQNKIDQELQQSGMKIEAIIVDINQIEYQSGAGLLSQIVAQVFLWFRGTSKSVRFDWKLWFQVTAQYWENTFLSENIYEDIYYILDIWDKIDVYLDAEDNSKYWMDVDSILKKNYKELNVVINKKWDELIIYWIIVLIMSILFMYQNWLDLTSRLSLFIILLFIVAICLIWFWVKRVIKQKNREKLEQSGTKVEATILLELAIPITPKEQDRYKLVDYKYKIVAKYNKETFLSDEYSKSIKIKKWAKIDVYLDESDHSKYWVDIDSISETNNDNTMIIN